MTRHRKYKERIKSAVIVILVISALLLAGRAGYYRAFAEAVGSAVSGGQTDQGSDAAISSVGFSMSKPLSMALCFPSGEKRSVQYSSSGLDDAYGRFSVFLGEALGSAGVPSRVSESQWRAALEGEGVYFYFTCSQHFSLLARSLGADASADIKNSEARSIFISCFEGEVRLYYMSAQDGQFYVCTTGAGAAAVSAVIARSQPDGAFFAYERPEFAGVSPYTLLSAEAADVRLLSAETAFAGDFDYDALFSAFGMNAGVMNLYSESDGTRVFVDGDRTLRIFADGAVTFRRTSSSEGDGTDIVSAAAAAFSLAARAAGTNAGAAELVLTGTEYSGQDGEYTFTMEYVANGIMVSLSGDDPAAVIVTKNGVVTRANFRLLTFSIGEADTSVLPAVQAAAAAKKGGYLRLAYIEESARLFYCGWVVD